MQWLEDHLGALPLAARLAAKAALRVLAPAIGRIILGLAAAALAALGLNGFDPEAVKLSGLLSSNPDPHLLPVSLAAMLTAMS